MISWINFDETTLQLSYNAISSSDPITLLTLYAEDGYNDRTSMLIRVIVDFKPTVNTHVTGLTGTFIMSMFSSFDIDGGLFIDENMATLSVTAALSNGSSLPSWLAFTVPPSLPVGSYQFSGIYTSTSLDQINITMTALDENGLTETVQVTIQIQEACHSTCLECNGLAIDQ